MPDSSSSSRRSGPEERRSDARDARPSPALASRHARQVRSGDSDYPPGLRDLDDAPESIYVRGTLPPPARAIAIVGSRAASPYGLTQARRLASDLARLGFSIVSGLARGIDAAAHHGALEASGATVAVLPAGLDAITPSHHRDLAERIAERGALLTEVAPGGRLWKGMFVERNRLIAAVAAATVVVEAAERSGALSTAHAARRLGRPLLAFPGDVDRPESRGCHELLRTGAHLCAGVADVVRRVPRGVEEGPVARVLAALDAEPRPLEGVARAAGITLEETLSSLLELEWSGLVVSRPGQRWARRASIPA